MRVEDRWAALRREIRDRLDDDEAEWEATFRSLRRSPPALPSSPGESPRPYIIEEPRDRERERDRAPDREREPEVPWTRYRYPDRDDDRDDRDADRPPRPRSPHPSEYGDWR
jgi:hypothetical protein